MAPEGVIIDGWNFVVAAYAVTAVVLVGYAWSLRSRLGKTQGKLEARKRNDG